MKERRIATQRDQVRKNNVIEFKGQVQKVYKGRPYKPVKLDLKDFMSKDLKEKNKASKMALAYIELQRKIEPPIIQDASTDQTTPDSDMLKQVMEILDFLTKSCDKEL